jgi:4-hydroxybenzoate polyprenyltransferase
MTQITLSHGYAPGRPFAAVRDWVSLFRPREWLKSVFVLAPFLFSRSLFNLALLGQSLTACFCFCLLASAVYAVNDLVDAEADQAHPRKKTRPIASGAIAPWAAAVGAFLLVAAALGLAFATLTPAFVLLAVVYVANSLAYCLFLKHRVILDVIVIAVGFVVRLLAGCVAIGVTPTSWLVVCGFSLALVLGFGKRRMEIAGLGREQTRFRPALRSYDAAKLDTLSAIVTALTLVAYMLYTVSAETVARHHTGNLIYTIPFVAYGLFRYLFKTQEGRGDGPADILCKDPVFALNGVLWVASVVAVLYWFR